MTESLIRRISGLQWALVKVIKPVEDKCIRSEKIFQS